MKYELVEEFLSTLFYSGGGDPSTEYTWAANDFLKVLEDMYSYKFKNEFTEEGGQNYDIVLLEIKELLS